MLLSATAFALYPVLWVIGTAFGAGAPERRLNPISGTFTLEHVRHVALAPSFATQVFNSVVVSLATAAVGVAIALPAAYALSRFNFVGKRFGIRTLLATQMFPLVGAAVPLYLLLDALGLLDTRTGARHQLRDNRRALTRSSS